MYDLVAEVGYDKASIGKICDFVGISKPSVYYYFPSKEEIFTTLLDSMFPTIDYQRDYSLIVDRDGFKAALIELGNSVIGGYRSDEKRRRVLAEVSVQANRIPAVQERQATATKRTMDALKDILLHGVEIGAFSDSADVMLYVQILYTVLEGASNTVAQGEDIDEKAVWAHGACGQPLKRKQGSTPIWLGVDPCCVAIYAGAIGAYYFSAALLRKPETIANAAIIRLQAMQKINTPWNDPAMP